MAASFTFFFLRDLHDNFPFQSHPRSIRTGCLSLPSPVFAALSQECKSIFWRELAIRASSGGGGSASGACFDGDSDAALLLQRPGHVVAFGFLATAPEFRRKGLASTLIRTGAEQVRNLIAAEAWARTPARLSANPRSARINSRRHPPSRVYVSQALAQGFVWGFAICNEQSLPVFARHGFERWGGLEYATFEHGGRRWFEGMPAHLKGMNVMAARLADVVAMLPQ